MNKGNVNHLESPKSSQPLDLPYVIGSTKSICRSTDSFQVTTGMPKTKLIAIPALATETNANLQWQVTGGYC